MATKKKDDARTSPAAATREYKTKRVVTVPTIKWELEKPVHATITGKMYKGMPQKAQPGKQAMEPATVVNVVNLDTGELGQLILGAALVSILNEAYPGDKYVGLSFRFTKHDKREGKRYYTYSVEEIEA